MQVICQNEVSYLNVSSPAISGRLSQLKFFLFEATMPFVRDLNENQEDPSYDASSHHHEDACQEEKDVCI